MSILPLGVYANLAISMNSVPVVVNDVIYDTVDGVDIKVPTETRNFGAAVEVNRRMIQQVFGELVSDGDIALWPEEGNELYFPDEFGVDARRQSFVQYRGINYKVVGVSDFTDQGSCKTFLATRHVAQDVPL